MATPKFTTPETRAAQIERDNRNQRRFARKLAFIAYQARIRFAATPGMDQKCTDLYREALTLAGITAPSLDLQPCETCECGTILPDVKDQNGHGECAECEGGFVG